MRWGGVGRLAAYRWLEWCQEEYLHTPRTQQWLCRQQDGAMVGVRPETEWEQGLVHEYLRINTNMLMQHDNYVGDTGMENRRTFVVFGLLIVWHLVLLLLLYYNGTAFVLCNVILLGVIYVTQPTTEYNRLSAYTRANWTCLR